jgi:quercetin dioxygenase-like cupin family protein
MNQPTDRPVDLTALTEALTEEARAHSSGRAAKAVMSGSHLRAVVIALRSGAELAEHDAPAAATLQVLVGAVTLVAGEERWDLTAGQLVAIPPRRHAVEAHEDSAVLLSVALH